MEGANPRTKCFIVEPWRFIIKSLEEIAQDLRCVIQNLGALFYTGSNVLVQFGRRQ